MVYILKKNNAMSELNSRSRETGPKRQAPKPNIGPKGALRRSAGFIRNVSIAVAVLFVCIIGAAAVMIFTPSDDKKEPMTADFTVGESTAVSKAAKTAVASVPKYDDKYDVSFTFYKKDNIKCTTSERTVGELIDILGIQLDENEKTKTDLSAVINKDTDINVDNVSYETVTEEYEIDYEIEYVDSESIPKGTTEVHQEGHEGIRTVTYTVTYLNGVEIEREKTDEYVSLEPVTMIVYNGVGGMVNIGGTYYSYSSTFECKSTVYSGGGNTASGIPASEDVIAVDPSVIPLGSRVYIEGVGIRTAADTGGVIKGNFIDIYYDSDNPAYWDYGVRYVTVYVLD